MDQTNQSSYQELAQAIAQKHPLSKPPHGFQTANVTDPFEAFLGPYFIESATQNNNTHLSMAFRVDDRHLNARGFAHGGALMSFADAVLGGIVWNATRGAPCVTLSLQTCFIKPIQAGDLVVCQAKLVRKTQTILFANGTFLVDEDTVLTASSVWKRVTKV